MSISKISLITNTKVSIPPQFKLKRTTLITAFVLSVFFLSELDLFFALITGTSLSNYAMYVLTDLMLTVIGIVTCSDLVVSRGRGSVKRFLAYMVLAWICITLIRLCQL